MRSLLLALAVAFCTVLPAQSQMSLPICFETDDATSSTSFPFNATTDHIWHWHYSNNNFATLTGPIVITDISLRASTPTGTIGAFDFPSVEVSMASATTGYQLLQRNPDFASNLGADLTVVRTGAWVGGPIPAAPAGSTSATWFSMGLTTPFVFDPTTGADLIIEIRKCGTNATFSGAIDGATGSTGQVGGNRYGDTASCTATNWTFNNNEFVPVVLLDYTTGGTPARCVQINEFQTNNNGAALTTNGLGSPGSGAPIQSVQGTLTTQTVGLSSVNNQGNPWDVAFTLGAPAIGLSGGGLLTPGFQTVNINLTAPSFTFLNNVFVSAPFVDFSLPIGSPAPLQISGQLGIIDPTEVDGFALSQANQIEWVVCSPASDFEGLSTGVNVPFGWTNASVAGTNGWSAAAGTTGSVATGPTSAVSGTSFLYCETSTVAGTVFTFDTCALDITTSTALTMDFELSRIGAAIGTLNIFMDDGAGNFTTLIGTYTGTDLTQAQGGIEWSTESISFAAGITSPAHSFRFEYTMPNPTPAGASAFQGDLAIDDLRFP